MDITTEDSKHLVNDSLPPLSQVSSSMREKPSFKQQLTDTETELPKDLDDIDEENDSSTRGDSEISALRKRQQAYKNRRWYRRICAFIMSLIMLAVLIVVADVIIQQLNKPDPPPGFNCIVRKKEDFKNSTDTEHALMTV